MEVGFNCNHKGPYKRVATSEKEDSVRSESGWEKVMGCEAVSQGMRRKALEGEKKSKGNRLSPNPPYGTNPTNISP